MERTVNRDCANCANYVPLPSNPELKSCCKWQCEYEPVARWIPGKPDGANHVLVTRQWQEDDLEVCELDYAVDKQMPGFVDNVSAWMPLPEPYKGEE